MNIDQKGNDKFGHLNFKDVLTYDDLYILIQRVFTLPEKYFNVFGNFRSLKLLDPIIYTPKNGYGWFKPENRIFLLKKVNFENKSMEKHNGKFIDKESILINRILEGSIGKHEIDGHGKEIDYSQSSITSYSLQMDTYFFPYIYFNKKKELKAIHKEQSFLTFQKNSFYSEMIALNEQRNWLIIAINASKGSIKKILDEYLTKLDKLRDDISNRGSKCEYFCQYVHGLSLLLYDKLLEKYGSEKLNHILKLPNHLMLTTSNGKRFSSPYADDIIFAALDDSINENSDIIDINKQIGNLIINNIVENQNFENPLFIKDMEIAKKIVTQQKIIDNSIHPFYYGGISRILRSIFGIFFITDKDKKAFAIWGDIENTNKIERKIAWNLFRLRLEFFDNFNYDFFFHCQGDQYCPIVKYLSGEIDFSSFSKRVLFNTMYYKDSQLSVKHLETLSNYIESITEKYQNSKIYKIQCEKGIREFNDIINNLK